MPTILAADSYASVFLRPGPVAVTGTLPVDGEGSPGFGVCYSSALDAASFLAVTQSRPPRLPSAPHILADTT